MNQNLSGLPGITPEIFREFIENMMRYYVSEGREQIIKTFRDRNRFFAYEITDIDLSFQAEVTDDGDCVINWDPVAKSGMRYIADAETFDDMMTGRVPAAEAFLRRRVKVKGALADAIRFLTVIPYLQRAYVKSRREIVEKYGLHELAREYPVPGEIEARV